MTDETYYYRDTEMELTDIHDEDNGQKNLRYENDKHLQINWGIAQINKKKSTKATKIYSKIARTFTFIIFEIKDFFLERREQFLVS